MASGGFEYGGLVPGPDATDAIVGRNASGVEKLTLHPSGRVVALDGVTIFTKAGAISDADFAVTPANGTIGIDTTNAKIYARIGGAWVKTAALT